MLEPSHSPPTSPLWLRGGRLIDPAQRWDGPEAELFHIVTGRYPWRTELKSQVLWPWDKPLIDKDRQEGR